MMRMPVLVLAMLSVGCTSSREAAPVLHVQGDVSHPQFAWYQVQRDGAWIKQGALITFYESGVVQAIQNVEGNVLSGPAWE